MVLTEHDYSATNELAECRERPLSFIHYYACVSSLKVRALLYFLIYSRPGDQHLNHGGQATSNLFEDVKPRISEYTAQEIATLQSRLEKQLGPEYISSRPGPGGQKVHYITGEKCIQLANEVFGFNGWSSSIMQIQVDYVDEDAVSRKVSLGLSVIVRVTLRDGTYHEDIGYGEMENCKGKGAAFHKAKKEATTDALKRALRNFGNVLGNCIYDKTYLTKVMKVKVNAPKWDVDALHRHSDHARVKKEVDVSIDGDIKQSDSSDLKKSVSDDSSTETTSGTLAAGGFLDEDFDGKLLCALTTRC
jgi:DNA repair and recombination protein RAD52